MFSTSSAVAPSDCRCSRIPSTLAASRRTRRSSSPSLSSDDSDESQRDDSESKAADTAESDGERITRARVARRPSGKERRFEHLWSVARSTAGRRLAPSSQPQCKLGTSEPGSALAGVNQISCELFVNRQFSHGVTLSRPFVSSRPFWRRRPPAHVPSLAFAVRAGSLADANCQRRQLPA